MKTRVPQPLRNSLQSQSSLCWLIAASRFGWAGVLHLVIRKFVAYGERIDGSLIAIRFGLNPDTTIQRGKCRLRPGLT